MVQVHVLVVEREVVLECVTEWRRLAIGIKALSRTWCKFGDWHVGVGSSLARRHHDPIWSAYIYKANRCVSHNAEELR